MKRKALQKTVAVVSAVALCMGVLAGCGSGSEDAGGSKDNASAESQTAGGNSESGGGRYGKKRAPGD